MDSVWLLSKTPVENAHHYHHHHHNHYHHHHHHHHPHSQNMKRSPILHPDDATLLALSHCFSGFPCRCNPSTGVVEGAWNVTDTLLIELNNPVWYCVIVSCFRSLAPGSICGEVGEKLGKSHIPICLSWLLLAPVTGAGASLTSFLGTEASWSAWGSPEFSSLGPLCEAGQAHASDWGSSRPGKQMTTRYQ